jgi:hypothetical protein
MSVVQDGTKADSLGARQHTWDNPPMPDWATTFPPQEARVRMCLDDIVTYKHPAVGARTANKVLKQMRARNTWLEKTWRVTPAELAQFPSQQERRGTHHWHRRRAVSVLQNPRVGQRQLERGTTGRLCSDALG